MLFYRKLFRNANGETSSLRLKNCPKEAWSGNPIASATCCMLQSVLNNNFLILPNRGSSSAHCRSDRSRAWPSTTQS